MICVNCGYCCIKYNVWVIKPEAIRDYLTIDDLNDTHFMLKPGEELCPYLIIDDKTNLMYCKIHDYDWYKLTPCFRHGQIESSNSICRIGQLNVVNNKKYSILRNEYEHMLQMRKKGGKESK